MSTAEILSLISTISYDIAAISCVLAVFFWFYFKIPSVVGDLSGRTARKSIARMRASNERAGGQGYKPSVANINRGKLTDTMQHAKKATVAHPKNPVAEDQRPETGLLAENKAVVLGSQQTELLDDENTTSMLIDEDATVPLHEEKQSSAKRTGGKRLTILDEVMLIHTDEVIR